MAPSIHSRMDSEEDMLDAEIMKAIRNSLKELNITSPLRPSRPPPGAVAHEENPNYSDEDNDDQVFSTVTKASEMERDLQESLKEVLVITDDDKGEDDDLTDEEEVSEATIASCKAIAERVEDEDAEDNTIASTASVTTVQSQKKSKCARLKEAIDASLADINQQSSSSQPMTPTKRPSRGTSPMPPPPVIVPSIVSKCNLSKEQRKGMYRPIIIDGCSMGFAYANHDRFCAEGMRVAYDCFKCLGYDDSDIVIIFKHIPQHYKSGRDQALIG